MNIIDHYPYFESNQVLTHTQLNELFNYLDNQNRLTRCKLIGIGIVCGLDVTAPAKDETEADIPIKISEGIGITSEGFLLTLSETTPKYYRQYKLPEGESYNPFEYTDSTVTPAETKQYGLLELIDEADYVESTDTEIDSAFLEDKVVIVFLEMYNYDPRSCLVRSCDEIGQTTYLKPRVLVATTEVAEKIRENTNLVPAQEDIFEDRFSLKTISLKRVLFNPDDFDGSTDRLEVLFARYRDAIIEVQTDLTAAIESTYNVYKPILLPLYGQEPNAISQLAEIMSDWQDYLSTEKSARDYFGMQYFYDFMKDLILAYDEFRFTAFDVVRKCNIDTDLFPRHLFFGEAYPNISDHDPQLNRNTFTQPYISKHLVENIEKVKSLHQRLVQMILNFNFDYTTNPSNGLDVNITPSKEKGSPLSERAIPFYYSINNGDSKLLESWNYELTRRRLKDENLSYHAPNYAPEKDPISDPLKYGFDGHSFLRIEGNNSAEADTIKEGIIKLREEFNLPFQVRLIDIDLSAENVEIDEYRAWKDLQTEYVGIRDNILCQVQNLVGSLKVPKGDDYQTECAGLIDAIKENYNLIVAELSMDLSKVEYEGVHKEINNLFENLIEFILYIKHLFGKLINEQFPVLPTPEFHERKQELNEMYYSMRCFLSGCQLYKLTTIIYRYQFRIEYLKANSTQILQNFMARHPGLEHMAGVPKGGTYIMVQDKITVSETETSRIVADFALPYSCCSEPGEIPSPETESENLKLPPAAVSDYFLVPNKGANIELDVLNNDLHRNASPVEISEVSDNANVVLEGGTIIYKMPEGASGIDQFEYTIAHTEDASQTSKARVKVLAIDPYKVLPKAIDDTDFTDINTEIDIDVLANDYYNDQTELQLVDGAATATSELGAELSIVSVDGRQHIHYKPSLAGRDSFGYRLVDRSRNPEVTSGGIVRVFVGAVPSGSGTSTGLFEVVQRNSNNTKLVVYNSNELAMHGLELNLIDADGNLQTELTTKHGTARISTTGPYPVILYTPNNRYYGFDVLNFRVSVGYSYTRISSCSVLVVCCCYEIPDYSATVNPHTEYQLNINLFADVYPGIRLTKIGQFDRDIVKAQIMDSSHLVFVPGDDIVYAGKYSFDYYATDSNNNCYKGKIILTSGTTDIEIPDVNVHVTTINPINFGIRVAEKYAWRIQSFTQIDESMGEISILDEATTAQGFRFIPAAGSKDLLSTSFLYTLVNQSGTLLQGNINLINLISGFLLPYINYDAVYKLTPGNDSGLQKAGHSVDIYDKFAILGAPSKERNSHVGGAHIFLKQPSGNWEPHTTLNFSYNFYDIGWAVALGYVSDNGYFALISSPETYGAGVVHEFRYNNSNDSWEEGEGIQLGGTDCYFGNSISLYQNTVAIGSVGHGYAYVYQLEGGNWVQKQQLQADDHKWDDGFGSTLSIYGSTIIVGAKGTGIYYIFEKVGDTWERVQKITPEFRGEFINSCAVYGEWIVIGSSYSTVGEHYAGEAVVYRRGLAGWELFQVLRPSDPEEYGMFGRSVAIEGDIIIVGSNTGSIYVFRFEYNEWAQKEKILPNDVTPGKNFAYDIALRNRTVIVGTPDDNINNRPSGSAYIFKQD